MVKWDGLSGRMYLSEEDRLTPASPSLREAYPGLIFLLRRVAPSAESAGKTGGKGGSRHGK
jgi:hypothetical protein